VRDIRLPAPSIARRILDIRERQAALLRAMCDIERWLRSEVFIGPH
jgi:hypothetical protein